MCAIHSRRRFSFGIRQLLLFVAVCAFALGMWNWLIRWRSFTISGDGIAEVQRVFIKTNRYPTGLRIRIVGNLDGQATITTPIQELTVGPEEFDRLIVGDYYDKEGKVRYSPSTARNGKVTIQYKFD
jgi:hypothetical protein